MKQGNAKEMVPILGIEGGGTKTSWILVGLGGRRLAGGVCGGSNLLLVGKDGLRRVLREVARRVPIAPRAIGAGFAGARGKPELGMARGVIRSVWPRAERVVVGQDTDSALAAAWGGEDGFLVIAGTGSNVIGRKGGRRQTVGGHGHLLGDAGSGYDLAQRAMEEVFRVRDREGKAPKLAAALLAHAGAADLDRLVREVYRPRGKEWLAGFAPLILRAAKKGDELALGVVRAGAGELAERAGELAKRMRVRGGRLFYVGAGTSGRLGVLDASEMPPTFHAPPEQVQAILAGGPEAIFRAQEGAEDDAEAGARAVVERRVGKRDVLVGLSASGRTPFVHGALREGSRAGVATVLVTAHPHWESERGGVQPDVVVRLDVGPELIAGSTRLKAGTVTKMVCNTLSSVAMIRLGRVYDNLMVHVVPSNEKLEARAVRLIRTLTGVREVEARRALKDSGGKVTLAVEKLKRDSRLLKKRRGALSIR